MKKQERKQLIKNIKQKITELNDIELLLKYYNGFNYDGELFDFDYGDYIFTISTDENGVLYLADNVDVFDKQGNFRGNYELNMEVKQC